MADPKSLNGFVKSLAIQLVAALWTCLLLVTAPAFTASAVHAETAFPELKLLTEEWKPYHYLEDGVVKGQTADLLVKILEKVGSE